MKKIIFVVAVLACAFAAVADDSSGSSSDTRVWLPLGLSIITPPIQLPVNLAGTCVGVQLGALNIASRTVGLQFGALNFTGDLHGVQLGVLNFSGSGGALVFPILNLGF